jgi:restriction endonuclease S subunit
MQKNLSKIADITSGYTFRGSVENQQDGDIFVLQAKNIIANADIADSPEMIKINSESLRNPYFLQDNDIVLVSRGSGLGSFRSSIFKSNKKNVIASSSVCIIRVKDVTVIPKYISLYLNSEGGQKEILQIVTGASYIQSILVKNLADFKIPIPPLHVQKLIISLNGNLNQQEKIIKKKKEIQQKIINSIFKNNK